jgi:hypothetical protein
VESYGVVWQENGREPFAGKLELDCDGLRLEGSDRDHLAVCALAYRELAAVRIDRDRADRLDGRPTLVLERSNGDTIRIAALVQAGIVTEIAERLAGFENLPRAASA